ncbi:MAG: hypothetical protein K8S97_07035 [Anaerolineae bacterium]|nr:hypothetical protein [Anaerolineae bacterium]
MSAFVYWRERDQRLWVANVLLFGGLGVMSAGGVVLEYAAARDCVEFPAWLDICPHVPYIEETLEIVGISLSLVGVLTYAQRIMTVQAWRRARLTLVTGSVGGVLLLLASVWVVPRWEAQYRAERVNVRYFEGRLSMAGYHVSDYVVRPGDEVTIDFYWRAHDWVNVNFNMSAQLLTLPDAQMVAEERVLILDPPASSWVPGVVRKQSVTFTIPDDLLTPASLVVTVPIWIKSARGYEQVAVRQSDVRLFNDYLPALGHITVLPDTPVPDVPEEVMVRFGSGFRLDGVRLPVEVTGILDVAFWWSSKADLNTDLVQIFHLQAMEGTDTFVFDQPPFGARFPTSDWVTGMRVMDEWQLVLPAEMPPGTYRVVTGLYDPLSGQREVALDPTGQPIRDNLVELGVVRKLE